MSDGLRPAHAEVLQALTDIGPATDERLLEHLGWAGSTMRPRRRELVEKGYVEAVGSSKTRAGRVAKLWAVVPAERRQQARDAARGQKRQIAPERWPLERQVATIERLLRIDAVNQEVLRRQGGSYKRARQRARESRTMLKEELREAERRKDRLVDFLKTRLDLRDAAVVVRGIAQFIEEDVAMREDGNFPRIPEQYWPDVVRHLSEVADAAYGAADRLAIALTGTGLDATVVDAEAVEIEGHELRHGE